MSGSSVFSNWCSKRMRAVVSFHNSSVRRCTLSGSALVSMEPCKSNKVYKHTRNWITACIQRPTNATAHCLLHYHKSVVAPQFFFLHFCVCGKGIEGAKCISEGELFFFRLGGRQVGGTEPLTGRKWPPCPPPHAATTTYCPDEHVSLGKSGFSFSSFSPPWLEIKTKGKNDLTQACNQFLTLKNFDPQSICMGS